MMSFFVTLLLPIMAVPLDDPGASSVADRITMRDGSVVLGQVVPSRPGAPLRVVVRREWARANVPERAEQWREIEEPWRRRARADRVDRLRRWRADRRVAPGETDPIASWIDREIERLSQPPEGDEPPLMLVLLDRSDVDSVDRRPDDERRMLRQGWRAGLPEVENMPRDRLHAVLAARGFAMSAIDPAPIDDLLPVPTESRERWLARRASTEVRHDPGLRLIRHGNLVLPETRPGAGFDQGQVAEALGGVLDNLLGTGPPGDPMRPYLDRAEASGKVGLVVTGLELAPDFSQVAVTSMLLVRTDPGRWQTAATRRSLVRPDALPPDAGQPLANDPQVQTAFNLLERLGLGRVDPALRQRSLTVGAATRIALNQAQSALDSDLRSASFRIDGPAEPPPAREQPVEPEVP